MAQSKTSNKRPVSILNQLLKNAYVQTNFRDLLMRAYEDKQISKMYGDEEFRINPKSYFKDLSANVGLKNKSGFGLDLGYNVPTELGRQHQIKASVPIEAILNLFKKDGK